MGLFQFFEPAPNPCAVQLFPTLCLHVMLHTWNSPTFWDCCFQFFFLYKQVGLHGVRLVGVSNSGTQMCCCGEGEKRLRFKGVMCVIETYCEFVSRLTEE